MLRNIILIIKKVDKLRSFMNAQKLWELLLMREDLCEAGIRFLYTKPESRCLRVTYPKGTPVHGLSIAVTSGVEGEPSTFETALIGKDEKVTYNDSLGYEDVCRFYTVDDLVTELIRLLSP